MSETKNAAPTGRRDFLRNGAMAAIVLPTIVSSLGSCAATKASSTGASAPDSLPPVDPAIAQRVKADAMDAMHKRA